MLQDSLYVHVEYMPMHGENEGARILEFVSDPSSRLKGLLHATTKSDVVLGS
jgi:hypothetical protein